MYDLHLQNFSPSSVTHGYFELSCVRYCQHHGPCLVSLSLPPLGALLTISCVCNVLADGGVQGTTTSVALRHTAISNLPTCEYTLGWWKTCVFLWASLQKWLLDIRDFKALHQESLFSFLHIFKSILVTIREIQIVMCDINPPSGGYFAKGHDMRKPPQPNFVC